MRTIGARSPPLVLNRIRRFGTASSMAAIALTSAAAGRRIGVGIGVAAFTNDHRTFIHGPIGGAAGLPRCSLRRSDDRLIRYASSSDATSPVEVRDDSGEVSSTLESSETAETVYIPPWSNPSVRNPSANAVSRFRQHVNPLARRYQMDADLPDGWPNSTYDDPSLPLYLDIGCGKGGFLLDLVAKRHGGVSGDGTDADADENVDGGENSSLLTPDMNYLGLEIRPGVAQYAQGRVEKRVASEGNKRLSFIGCNANVDLDRILALYQNDDGDARGPLALISIQYPDPHFKKQHAKRRVVTTELITTLARRTGEGSYVFLQSDVKDVLDDMRDRFRIHGEEWWVDEVEDVEKYIPENPLGVPTEREMSVLKKGLPVYRTLFRRNDRAVVE